MRCLATILVLFTLTGLGLDTVGTEAYCQNPGPGIGFRNDLKVPVIVQGVCIVNNMPRRGQPILVAPGKTVWDNNLPAGVRYYTIYDGNQQRVLLKERLVRVQNVDQFFGIRVGTGPTANQVIMNQEPVPVPMP